MAPPEGNELDDPGVEYPRFDHGEDLVIVVREESIEFRRDAPGQFVRADNVVHVEEVV